MASQQSSFLSKAIALAISLLSVYQISYAQTEQHRQYIDRFYPIAVAEMERSGIPASIKLAQGILESGVGRSELATNAIM